MAKPKSPLLSLGARGSIGDTLTFQKRGRITIARQKPIPKDPKSEAQLARRQIYKEAVAAWHALSPEGKEAWRGICRGLTAYQCFMRSELNYVPAPPPPEEQTEEQTEHNVSTPLYGSYRRRAGQRLTISNRTVTKLGFWLLKANLPTGDVTFEIRKVSDDSLICSKVWGDAGDLTVIATYCEVEFDTPPTINEEVRICVLFLGGDPSNVFYARIQDTDVKADEYTSLMLDTTWTDITTADCAYRYKYYEV